MCKWLMNDFSTFNMLTNSYVYGQKMELHTTMKVTLRSVLQFLSIPKLNYLGLAHIAGQVNKGVEKKFGVSSLCKTFQWFLLPNVNKHTFPNLESGKIEWGWNVWHVYTSGSRG